MERRRYAFTPQVRAQAQMLLWLAPAFLALLLLAAFVSPPRKGSDISAFAGLIVFSVAAVLFALWLRSVVSATVDIDDEVISYRRGGTVVTMRWQDVRRAEYRHLMQRLKIVSASGEVIYVDKQFEGFEEIASMLAQQTGRDVL